MFIAGENLKHHKMKLFAVYLLVTHIYLLSEWAIVYDQRETHYIQLHHDYIAHCR